MPKFESVPKAENAVFVGCARNCAEHLPAVLANVFQMAGAFSQAAFIFVTNDNTDDTLALLEGFAAATPDFHVINLDGLAGRMGSRTERLAECRNVLVAHARKHYGRYDYMIMMDCDDSSTHTVEPAALTEALAFLNFDARIGAAFPNQHGFYCDLWALRHPQLCPGDIWEAVGDQVFRTGCTDTEAFRVAFEPRMFGLRPDAKPLEVRSAFGGLGIYKMRYVRANHQRYVGSKTRHHPWANRPLSLEVCEHVSFNNGIAEAGGRMFILPWLISQVSAARQFQPAAWRGMWFDPESETV